MRRILLVDDSAIAREPLAKLLAYEGYDVLAASNGLEAMETLRAKLEDTLNEATRRAYAQVGRPEQAGHG